MAGADGVLQAGKVRENQHMASDRRQGKSHEGIPEGDPMIEVTVRLFPRSGAGEPSFPPRGGPFSGATIEWSYPENLHERALTPVTVIRHAIGVLLDELQGSTTVDVQ
jgi:hypothetical protein